MIQGLKFLYFFRSLQTTCYVKAKCVYFVKRQSNKSDINVKTS
jgi:hypothetical protein